MCAQLAASSLTFSYGPHLIIDRASFTVAPDDRLGIVGPNGSGKSTLLRLLAGELEPQGGSLRVIPSDASVILHHQVVETQTDLGILDWLRWRSGVAAVEDQFEVASRAIAEATPGADEQYDRALARFLAAEPASFPDRAAAALDQLALATLNHDHPVRLLSGGQRTRLQLAALGLVSADVLLLDEPTNDLDSAGLAYLEDILDRRAEATVVVSHDREFLSGFVTGVLEIDGHDHSVTRYEGGFDAWLTQRETARRHESEAWEEWSSTKADLANRAQRERQWSQKGVRKAKASDEPDKTIRQWRIEKGEQLAARASRTERAMERHEKERVEKPWVGWELQLSFASAARAGSEVARADGATVSRGAFTFGPVSVVLGSGDRVLLRGPNGSGKTTLLDLLFGDLQPVSGSAGTGPGTVVGLMTQGRDVFGSGPLLEAFIDRSGLSMADARSQLAKLGLDAEHSQRPAAELSPGEQTRAILGLFAATGVNTMVLDEPTNHLDLEAIEQLESALDRFDGTIVLVTHDRQMAERFHATHHWDLHAGTLAQSGV
ncbi:MAG: ABC-F family ATP-binding cassette domain-containing protein [Acidimicrobiales bacterium]|nr:MAG: ABC-F family ATP-binding cassette domain-containing protein [Acidimicrobiales bacterium]